MEHTKKGGIIVYREQKYPQLFTKRHIPILDKSFNINIDEKNIEIFIFYCPVYKSKLSKNNYMLLKDLVDKNGVGFLVEHFETNVKSNISIKKSQIHYTEILKEIKSIKELAKLLKMCQDKDVNLLDSNIGFIVKEIDTVSLDIISEEAINIIIYEDDTLNQQVKNKMHEEYMKNKGISIVFTKDIMSLIINSNVIFIEEELDEVPYNEYLKEKKLIYLSNKNKSRDEGKILLWFENIDENYHMKESFLYNDEILTIIRYFNLELDRIEFVKKLPYILNC